MRIASLVAGLAALVVMTVGVIASPGDWLQATPGRILVLPADHASHPDYRLEWWYYTGQLATRDGRRFGYQVTFFRIGVDRAPANPSRWAVRDLHMAHFAVTDVRAGVHRVAERMNRSGPGWAGAATDRLRVWNEQWEVTQSDAGRQRLRASDEGLSLELDLTEARPVVRHGLDGYSQKGPSSGNASYYYSFTRMPTTGRLTLDGQTFDVSGDSWMDHEFGSSVLEGAQRGWDWFSLQLSDGRDLMIFQLRDASGAIDPRSGGTLVESDGTTRPVRVVPSPLQPSAIVGFSLTPGRTWRSPVSEARYPVAWRLAIPGLDADLSVSTPVDAQELRTTRSTGVTYWEGTIDVRGTLRGRPVSGRGYLEMTGYAGRVPGL